MNPNNKGDPLNTSSFDGRSIHESSGDINREGESISRCDDEHAATHKARGIAIAGDGSNAKSEDAPLPKAPAHPPPVSTPRGDPKDNKKRIFGIARDRPSAGPLPDDYEHRYPEDEFGEEMGPAARVWRVYLDEAEFNDKDMVEGWKDGIDVLLVFAGLFSAVVTTFVTQTSQKLDVDYSEVSASLLMELISLQRALGNGTSLSEIAPSELNPSSPAHFGHIDTWVNALWFTSLSFSLVTALGAVVIKQWIQHYVSLPSGTPHERVRLHQFRYMGIQRWSVPAIIGVLPVLMHVALFLFFGGLVAFLSALKKEIAWSVGVVGGVACVLYVITNILPLRYPECPYRTPLIVHAHTLASITASAVHRGFVFSLYRILPQVSLKTFGGTVRKSRFMTWCEKRLRTRLPRYTLKPLRDVEIEAAANTGAHLDLDAIQWLYNFTSNPSVRSIALQAFSGIRYVEQKFALADTFMKQELIAAVKSRLLLAVSRRYYKDPFVEEFVQSGLFMELERLLRASVLIFDTPVFNSTLTVQVVTTLLRKKSHEVDKQRLLAYTAYAFSKCNAHGPDVSLSDPEFIQLAGTLFEMSEINQHPAGKHPLIWKGFFVILDRFASIFYGNTSVKGFLTSTTNLCPLLNMLLLSELSYPGQTTDDHQKTVESIIGFVYRTIGNGLPRQMSTMFPVPSHDKGTYDFRVDSGCSAHLQFWVVMMKGIISICTEDAYQCRLALLEHMVRLSHYCHRYPPPFVAIPDADFMSILAVLDDLFHQHFFLETKWDSATYEEIFFLYLKLESHHDTGHVLIQPLLQLISVHIGDPDLADGLFGSLGRIVGSYTFNHPESPEGSKNTEAASKVVQGTVECLRKLRDNKNFEALDNIFVVLAHLNWLEDLMKNVGTMIDRRPPILDWRFIQPLVHILLEIASSYLDPDANIPLYLKRNVKNFHRKIRAGKTLEILCEMFICPSIPDPYPMGDVDMPAPGAHILLHFAERDRYDNTPWLGYIDYVYTTFTRLHSGNPYDRAKQAWTEWDYAQYNRVASFMDELMGVLRIPSPEYEILRFDDTFIANQLQMERTRTFDILPGDDAKKTLVKRRWKLALGLTGALGRVLHRNRPSKSHDIDWVGDKEGDSTLV